MAPYFSIVRLSQNFILPRGWTVNLFLVGREAVEFGALSSVCLVHASLVFHFKSKISSIHLDLTLMHELRSTCMSVL